jgi:hypothetical protein
MCVHANGRAVTGLGGARTFEQPGGSPTPPTVGIVESGKRHSSARHFPASSLAQLCGHALQAQASGGGGSERLGWAVATTTSGARAPSQGQLRTGERACRGRQPGG